MGRKDRHTLILVLTLAGLAVLSLGLRWWDGRGTGVEDTLQPLFRTLRQDQVASLRVEGPEDQGAAIRREGDRWLLDGGAETLADDKAVVDGIQKLIDLPRGRVIQPDNTDLERFGLEGPERVRVTLQDEGEAVLVDLLVGRVHEGATYLMAVDEQVVRRVDTNVRSRFVRADLQGWRDRSIVPDLAPETIRRIRVESPTWTLVLERTEEPDQWRMLEPGEGLAVPGQVDPLLRQVTRLSAQSFYGGPLGLAELGLDPPSLTVTAERDSGPAVILHLGDRLVDSGYAVRRPDQEPIWLVARFRGDILRREPRLYLPRQP